MDTYFVGTALFTMLALLVYWRLRGKSSHQGKWLKMLSIPASMVGASLLVLWGWRLGGVQTAVWMALACGAVIIARDVGVDMYYSAKNDSNYGTATLAALFAVAVYGFVVAICVLEVSTINAGALQAEMAASAPVKALDMQIANTEREIADRAKYADKSKADSAKQSEDAKNRKLAELKTQRAACPAGYIKNCIAPLDTKIAQLESSQPDNTHLEYAALTGFMAHKQSLYEQRAAMLNRVGGIGIRGAAAGADDALLADFFHVTPERAGNLKSLAVVFNFEFVAFYMLILGVRRDHELGHTEEARKEREQVHLLVNRINTVNRAATLLARNGLVIDAEVVLRNSTALQNVDKSVNNLPTLPEQAALPNGNPDLKKVSG